MLSLIFSCLGSYCFAMRRRKAVLNIQELAMDSQPGLSSLLLDINNFIDMNFSKAIW